MSTTSKPPQDDPESGGETINSDEPNSAEEDDEETDTSFVTDNSDSDSSYVNRGKRKRASADEIASEDSVHRLQDMLLRSQERCIAIQCRIEGLLDKTGRCARSSRHKK